MVFSSRVFLFLFLPAVLLVYFTAPRRLRNSVLLLASLFFYCWGEPRQFGLMLASIGLNHLLGLLAGWSRGRSAGRQSLGPWVIGLTVAANLGLLGYYKYANFVVDSLNPLLAWAGFTEIVCRPIALPVGISFYTFQAMSYVIDVYRGEVPAEKNPLRTALYISLFPQLIAGPIVRYTDVAADMANRNITLDMFAEGVRRFLIGLAKKVLLANSLATAADAIFEIPDGGATFTVAWLGIVCYALQLYFDFSGYSDMAIGLGWMLGFRFLENFDYPYISRSITEFWRRWHLSLSTWFRDYLYVPLGGNRRGTARTYFNLLTVFLLCGLWHGASWSFVLWGLFHGAFLIAERAGLGRFLEARSAFMRHAYTLVVLAFGWVLFRAESPAHAVAYWKSMVGLGPSNSEDGLFIYLSSGLAIALAVALVSATPAWERLGEWAGKLGNRSGQCAASEADSTPLPVWLDGLWAGARVVSLGCLLFATASALMASTYNPFIYFRF
jgi:alginate O-acetyltransferase complex protein AlgI